MEYDEATNNKQRKYINFTQMELSVWWSWISELSMKTKNNLPKRLEEWKVFQRFQGFFALVFFIHVHNTCVKIKLTPLFGPGAIHQMRKAHLASR